MHPSIDLKKFRLASDRTATLTVGTTTTPKLADSMAETVFHLHFGSTLGVNIAPIINFFGQTEGVAIHLQGRDCLEQLTDALEVGSRVLRWQTDPGTGSLRVEQWGVPDERRLTVEEELAAIGWVPNWVESDPMRRVEQVIIEFIILFGAELLPDGTPVATYLINALAHHPLTGLW